MLSLLPILSRFLEQAPVPMMAQTLIERSPSVPRRSMPSLRRSARGSTRAMRESFEVALRAPHGVEVAVSLSCFHLGQKFEYARRAGGVRRAAGLDGVRRDAYPAGSDGRLAASANLFRYQKASHGPKQPPLERFNEPAKPTVSTARPLAARRGKKAP